MKKLFALLLANLMLVLGMFSFKPTKSVSANSAQHFWRVVNGTGGPTITDGESPIVVQKENLSFYLDDENAITSEQANNYNSYVNAEYTFYNPSNDNIRANLVFPMGNFPSYLNDNDNFSNYHIYANGEEVDYKLRCTYKSLYSGFVLEDDIKLLREQKVEDEYYNDKLPVYKYTYKFSRNFNNPDYCYVIHVNHDREKMNIISELYPYYQKNDYKEFHLFENEISIYVIGEDYDVKNNAHIYEVDNDKRIETHFDYEVTRTECTFDDLIYTYYDEKYDRIDYYNAVQDYLDTIGEGYRLDALYELDLKYELLRWYGYELDFAPKSQVINSVNAPMYPQVDYGYSSPVYSFKYFLTPASTWSDFKDLQINIYTKQHLLSSAFAFEEIEGGYSAHFDTLPNSDLAFSTCLESAPHRYINIAWTIFAIILIVILLLIIAIPAIIVIVYAHKKKRRVGVLDKTQKFLLHESTFAFIDIDLLLILGLTLVSETFFLVVQIALIILIIVLQIINGKRANRFNARLVLSIVNVVVSFLVGFIEGYFYTGSFIFINIIFMTIIGISALVAFNRCESDNDTHLMSTKIETKGFYMLGALEKKTSVLNYLSISIFIVLMGALTILTALEIINPIITIVLFIVFTIALLIAIYKINANNNRDLLIYVKDLDFNKLETNLCKKLENPRVHPETKNYYLMILASCALCVDINKFVELKSQIVCPKYRPYQNIYRGLEINFLLTSEELDEAYAKLMAEFPKDRALKRNCQVFAKRWKPYYTGTNANESPAFSAKKSKNQLQNAIHLFIQIGYYKKNNNIGKANELEQEFRTKYSSLPVMISELNGEDIRQTYRYLLNKLETNDDGE